MKKTLLTATLALLGAALAPADQVVTFTCTEDSMEAAGHNAATQPRDNLNAFNFDLGNALWLTQDPQDLTLPETVYLKSMEFYFYSTGTDACGVAIYQLRDADDTGLVHLDYIGKSNWLSAPEGGLVTTEANIFTFDDVALQTGENYTLMFYGHQAAFNELKEGHVLTGETVKALIDGLAGISVSHDKPISSPAMHVVQMDEKVASGGYDDDGDFHPKVGPEAVFTVSIPGPTEEGVPEPTTATLSLLGLVGLCARRRRK